MTYNLSNIDAQNTTLGMLRAINNDLTNKLLVHGFLLIFFLIIFSLIQLTTNDFRKSLLGSAFISFVLATFILLPLGFINWWICVVFLVLIILGIIINQDKHIKY